MRSYAHMKERGISFRKLFRFALASHDYHVTLAVVPERRCADKQYSDKPRPAVPNPKRSDESTPFPARRKSSSIQKVQCPDVSCRTEAGICSIASSAVGAEEEMGKYEF
jgi:hypothetical protein